MRLKFLFMAVLPLLAACAENEIQNPGSEPSYTYFLEGGPADSTRITIGDAVNGVYPCLWTAGDALEAFRLTGGSSTGTATITEGEGDIYGKFTLVSSAEPGTEVRLIYPAGSLYGGGNLAGEQLQVNSARNNISAYTHAYSQPVPLISEETVPFTLKHALAVVKIEYSCKDIPSNGSLQKVTLKCLDGAVAGPYGVDYDSGAVTPGAGAQNSASLTFTGGLPGISTYRNQVWMVALPSQGIQNYYVNLQFTCNGETYVVPVKFKARLLGGQVNTLDCRNFSINEAVHPVTLHLIGDSTCAVGNLTTTNYRGWGQIARFFLDGSLVTVNNHAVGGRSTKTFRSEGDWDSARAQFRAGDIVALQFGHNDENTDERGTTPEEYYNNLSAYVDEIRSCGAVPVLLTPILRRLFNGNVVSDNTGSNFCHVKYAPQVKKLADEKKVRFVDALELTRTWLTNLGDEASKNRYVWFNPGDYSSAPEGKQDNVHLNQIGAWEVAGMILSGIGSLSGVIGTAYSDCAYSTVEKALGVIKVYYPDGSFGTAGTMDPHNISRYYDDVDYTDVEVYDYPSTMASSDRYSVSVEGKDAKVIVASSEITGDDYAVPTDSQSSSYDEPELCVFGADREVSVKVRFLKKTPSSIRIAPVNRNYSYSLSGNELTITLKAYDRISVEADGDLLHPLFIFVNPCESQALNAASADPDTQVLRAGFFYGNLSFSSIKKVYVQGGAVVTGYARSTSGIDGLELSGCGILDGRSYSGSVIDIHYSRNAKISNLTVINKKNWSVRFAGCDNLLVDNLKVVASCPFNDHWDENDAIHLMACVNSTVQRCFGYSWDDAFTLNSTYISGDELRYTTDVHDVTFQDCIGWNVRPGNSFEIGYNNMDDVHDVLYKDCISIHSGTKGSGNTRAGFSIQDCREGTVYNIRYEDCCVEDPAECAITCCIKNGSGLTDYHPGSVHDITYKNIKIGAAPKWGCAVFGYGSTNQVRNIVFDNVSVNGTKLASVNDAGFVSSKYPLKHYYNISFK